MKTFDMQFIRYMNLFSKVTHVNPKHCFSYNNGLVFIVPKNTVQGLLGGNNENLRQLSDIFGKRIRIVAQPSGEADMQKFIAVIVAPIQFDKAEIIKTEAGDREIIITTSNRESKAMLIGRGRARETELKDILEQYFGVKILRIN